MSLMSMTGFGRAEESEGAYTAAAEVKTLNHRFLDVSVHLSSAIPTEWEVLGRRLVERAFRRGRVEVFLTLETHPEVAQGLSVDRSLAREYYEYLKELSEIHNLAFDLTASQMARLPGVVHLQEVFPEPHEIESLLRSCLSAALEEAEHMRREEGNTLQERLRSLLEEFSRAVEQVRESAPEVERRRCEAVIQRVRQLLAEELRSVEDLDIRSEVALAVQRTSVVEEIGRLESHIEQFASELSGEKGSGRKLEFLAGEMLRETNTVAAKVADSDLSAVALRMKTALEDIREQVRNIE